MKLLPKYSFILTLLFYTSLTFASGERTAVITLDAIKNYRTLIINADELTESRLNYIGTYNNKYHILMITKHSVSKDKYGRPGMPWDHVSKYKISTNKINILNGWQITDKMIEKGLKVRPSNCPSIYLSNKTGTYTLKRNSKIISNCINN